MHRVVVVGAGFGGLSAARSLIGKPVDVTIVDQRNFHTFQPLLYEVATAGLDSGDVAYPIRAIFGRADNVTFRFATVTAVDWERHLVLLQDGEPLPFDSVIVASGATARFFASRERRSSPSPSTPSPTPGPCGTTCCAPRGRRLEPLGGGRGFLNFVVVGGGPTGVEVAGALAELLDVAVRHDGFGFARRDGRIILVDGLDRLLTPFKPRPAATPPTRSRVGGWELVLGRMVQSVDGSCVRLDDGTEILTKTVVWRGASPSRTPSLRGWAPRRARTDASP